METNWYYAVNGQERKGPVPEGELKQLLGSGQLPASTLVWCEGLPTWTPAQDVAALHDSPPPMPPPEAESQWFYSADGKAQQGPVVTSELKRLLAAGQLPWSTLVWSEGRAGWAPASTLAALQPGGVPRLSAAPQPLPAGPFCSRTHNRELMTAARGVLAGQWGAAVCPGLLYFAISIGFQLLSLLPLVSCVASICQLLIEGALLLGMTMFFLALARAQLPSVGMMFNGFNQFGTALGACLLMALFTILWLLLLIIPGIIASYRYAMTYYILADHPELGPLEAIRRSKELMRGNKLKLFCLGWRFFWWILFCLLTCGIGFIWLVPYMQTSLAKFYEDLKPVA
jgi:uncharacterized membrane protein